MARLTLDIEYDYDFVLIGISCHLKDYRLCWTINSRGMGIDFTKTADIEIHGKNQEEASRFSQFIYDNEDINLNFNLISNRGSRGYLIPEQKQADYLLMVTGNFTDSQTRELLKDLKEIDFILTAFTIDVNKLKSKQNLLF